MYWNITRALYLEPCTSTVVGQMSYIAEVLVLFWRKAFFRQVFLYKLDTLTEKASKIVIKKVYKATTWWIIQLSSWSCEVNATSVTCVKIEMHLSTQSTTEGQ